MKAQILRTIAAAVFAASLAGAAARADDQRPDQDGVTFSFGFSAARLATEEGAADVYRDLQVKAYRACRRPGLNPIELSVDHACAANLVDDVVAQIGAPTLTALHEESQSDPRDPAANRIEFASR